MKGKDSSTASILQQETKRQQRQLCNEAKATNNLHDDARQNHSHFTSATHKNSS
jgi:hypothetical protein